MSRKAKDHGTEVVDVDPENTGRESALTTKTDGKIYGREEDPDIHLHPSYRDKTGDGVHGQAPARIRRANPLPWEDEQAGPWVYAVGDEATYARPAAACYSPCHTGAVAIYCFVQGSMRVLFGVDWVLKEDPWKTQMVPIGQSRGVGAAMGYQLPSLTVWLAKGRGYWLWTMGGLWSGR